MKVIVFGATGTIGKIVVRDCLKEGHKVVAYSRRPEKIGISNPNLQLASGDATDPIAVDKALEGADAVIITLGAGNSRSSTIRSRGTLTVIEAMHRKGIKRLICQSTLGAHESWENLNFFWKRIMFGALLRPVFLDHQVQEDLVRASGLDWTIVRPSAFTDDQISGGYKEHFGPSETGLSLKISRKDVADFLTRQIRDHRYMHAAVGISN